MREASVIGIDLAKNVFMVVGMDREGRVLFRKKMLRDKLSNWVANHPLTLIGMEACGGSHYWARVFSAQGHRVKLIAPKFVKPYVKSNKNDSADAEAICEAVTRPTMRFVQVKSQTQQEIQMLHRARERMVRTRTALVNEFRGFLAELGIVMPQGITTFRRRAAETIEANRERLSDISYELFVRLLEEFVRCDSEVQCYDKKLTLFANHHPECQRLQTIPGVGPMTATAIISTVGDMKSFKNGRQFAASLGLVPRQHSSGGKDTLLGISKRGDIYLRKLLVHGARSVVRFAKKHTNDSERARWIVQLVARRGTARAAVAVANKNARIIWALLAKQQVFDTTHRHSVVTA